MDPYDPRNELLNASLLLTHHEQLAAGVGLAVALVRRHADFAPGWVVLARTLTASAREDRDLDLLREAAACARRAQQLDPQDAILQALLSAIREQTPIGRELDDLAPFAGDPEQFSATVGYEPKMLVGAVAQPKDYRERLQLVMWLGDQNHEDYVPILVDRLRHDPNPDVRMGAVKRLAPWLERTDVRDAFEALVDSGEVRLLEPYVTMTISDLGAWGEELATKIASATSPDGEKS